MTRFHLLAQCAALAMFAFASGGTALGQEASGPVSISLRDKAVVSKCCVRLGEIADLEGGPEILRKRIAEMDVDELSTTESQAHICPRAQVQFRLRLAAIPADYFVLGGAPETAIILRPQPLSAAMIEEAAREELYRRLPWSRDDLSLQLLRPITVTMPAKAEDETLTLDVEPNRPNVGLGHVQMNVAIRVAGEQRLSLPVYFNVQMVQEVAVCRRRIEIGEVLTEADLIRQRRPIGPNDARVVRPDALIGKKLRRAMQTGQVVVATDVDAASNGAFLVQPHQPVRMTVHLGSMDVVAIGEAMEGGADGKLIRVRNIDTKAIVTGRVTGPRAVEVESGVR
jgi:flagella basal body P-ring formation protein FlgA